LHQPRRAALDAAADRTRRTAEASAGGATPVPDSNPIRARQAKDQYERDKAAWLADVATWDATADHDIAAFKFALDPLLARAPQGNSDLWSAVRSARSFFTEPGLPEGSSMALIVISGRERGTHLCPGNKGTPTAPPGFELEILDRSGGSQVWVCGYDGTWHAKALLPKLPSGAVDLAAAGEPVPEAPAVPLPAGVCVLVVKAKPVLGPLDERANCGQFSRLQEAVDHLVARLGQAQAR
jgi:hypothetical protein